VDRERPAVERLVAEAGSESSDDLLQRSVRANILAAVNQLQHGSPLVEHLVRQEGLLVAGAEYSLETGIVSFLEGTRR
jgi:carbonic anhydrase